MRINDKEIIPNYGIGNIILGMTYLDFTKISKNDTIKHLTEIGAIITLENAKLWFNKNNILYQIMVFGDFGGKYKNSIGIGSTLKDVEDRVGNYEEDGDVYILTDYPGICFELMDVDDWEERTAPIEMISIYSI